MQFLAISLKLNDSVHDLVCMIDCHAQEAMLEAWSNKEALHFIVADQAGSGKTLAYLLPLIQVRA